MILPVGLHAILAGVPVAKCQFTDPLMPRIEHNYDFSLSYKL